MCGTFELSGLAQPCIEACEPRVNQLNAAEHDLVRRLQSGPEMNYPEFVERYQSTVYRVAYGILANRQDADEVAQRVFVKAHFSLTNFDGRSSLFTWVYRIVVNECYEFLRKKCKRVLPGSNSTDNFVCTPVPMTRDAYPVPDRVVSQRDLLNELLERIPEEDRCLLLLRELEGYSVGQLAEATGINEHTIRVTLFRTRQRLAKAAAQLSLDAGRARHETC
jgi:RNA polymerase sigma-70 factor, ECF subfamily